MKFERQIQVVDVLTNIGYIIAALSLYSLALWIMIGSFIGIFTEIAMGAFTIYNLLDEVSLIIFSFAVIDVCKYITIEEVIKKGRERSPVEERRVFTKTIVIIITALSLEGLVLTIEMAKTKVTHLPYAIAVLGASAILILSLGIYQYLNRKAEHNIDSQF